MTPGETWHLVTRLLRAEPGRSAGLVLGLAATGVIPALTLGAAAVGSARASARLAGAPIVVLAPGDPVVGTWSALTGQGAPTALLPAVVSTWPGSLPLRTGRTVQGAPLVGVDAAWLPAWGLSLDEGRAPVRPGEVVVGARAARRLAVQVGDAVQADPEVVVQLDPPPGPPLTVVGRLARAGTPEDHWVLTSLATTWMLDGAVHGEPDALHLHGDAALQPLSAVVVRPESDEERDLLLVSLDARPDLVGVQPAALLRDRVGALCGLAGAVGVVGAVVLGALAVLMRSQLAQHRAARADLARILEALGASPRQLRRLWLMEATLLGTLAAGVAVAVVSLSLAIAGVAL